MDPSDMTLETVLTNYRNLVDKVDRLCLTIHQRYASAMVCRRGCHSCCRHLSLFPVEAVSIRLALDSLDQADRETIMARAGGASEDVCPLLDQGICLMYAHRPIICRTHGLPILVDRGQERVVDFCPMNFGGISELDRELIIDLDQLNTTFALINRLFVEQVFEDNTMPERLSLADALLLELDPEE